MTRAATALLAVAALTVIAPSARAAQPSAPAAVLVLEEITHALSGRTLVISGVVRNAGRLPVSRLVIDASGFSPTGDLAAFGGDGVPWDIPPERGEHFRIFLPLGQTFVSTYTVAVTGSRPRQARATTVTRAIFPRFYRPLILPRVRVTVSAESYALTFTASAEGLPVSTVEVSVQLLVDELRATQPDLRVLAVEVPVDRPLRMRFAPLIVKVLSVTVVDVVLTSSWTAP